MEKFNESQTKAEDRKSGFMTCTWLSGMLITLMGSAVHSILVTPYADIVLLSFNAALAILIQVLMAIVFLKEVVVCKYDIPAITLILIGSSCIILTANFSEDDLTASKIKESLSSVKSIGYFAFTLLLINVTFFVKNRMLKNLAIFERDVEIWLHENEMQHISEVGDSSTLASGSEVFFPSLQSNTTHLPQFGESLSALQNNDADNNFTRVEHQVDN